MHNEEHGSPKTYEWAYDHLFYVFLFIIMCYFLKTYSLHLFGGPGIIIRRKLIVWCKNVTNLTGIGLFNTVSKSMERKNTVSIKQKMRATAKANQTKLHTMRSLRVKNCDDKIDFFKDLGENMELLEQAFNMFDADGSGTISRNEFRNVVRSLGHNPSEEQINLLMAKVDADGNGNVDSKELLDFMKSQFGVWDPEGDLLPVFQMLSEPDPNQSISSTSSGQSSGSEEAKNGTVKGKTVKNMISDYHSADFKGKELDELLSAFDDDGDYDFNTFIRTIAGEQPPDEYCKNKFILDSSLSYSPGM